MNKLITLEQAVEKVHDGMTIMFGGFLGVGSATQIIDAIVEKGVKVHPGQCRRRGQRELQQLE